MDIINSATILDPSLILRNVQKAVCSPRSDEIAIPWNGNPAIFSKYDWATFVFKNVSISDVFDCIQFDQYCTNDFAELISRAFFTAQGRIPEIRLIINGIMLQVQANEATYKLNFMVDDLNEVDPWVFFNTKFDYIRLEFSGSGLDYFRSSGCDIDRLLSSPFDLPDGGSYHSTRLDWAFDLVNYRGDFLQNCIEDCRRLSHPSTYRIPTNKHAIVWSEKGGREKTLYLGSTGSERLLRIYDKKMQYARADKLGSIPYKCGDLIPDTWIRIELQTRNNLSSDILYNCSSSEQCLRYIYDQFAMRDVKKDYGYERVPGDILPYWNDLFNFDMIPELIHNKNFVQYREPVAKAIDYIFGQAASNIILLLAKMGSKEFLDTLDELLLSWQLSNLPCYQAKIHKLKLMLLSQDFNYPDFIYVDEHGLLKLRR